jgi:two-component system chemotaxis response regulator CheB
MHNGLPDVAKVMVVEGSDDLRLRLIEWLQADPQIRVVQQAGTARQAIEYLQRERPDVVLMDNHMPDLDGFEATRSIMETHPLPIVLYAEAATVGEAVFRALEAGAVACIEKPLAGNGDAAVQMRQMVKLMSEVRVVRRWQSNPAGAGRKGPQSASAETGFSVIGIGASTGGPLVLQTILADLPANFPLPVLVVQHIAKGFLPSMAEWLRQTSGPTVQIAAYGVRPLPGHVYLAPDDFQMGLGTDGRILLAREHAGPGLRPSVAHLFRSLAQFPGGRVIGVLLTGMGKDGAAELKQIRERGGVTIAQDKASSVVHGMPGEAIAQGAAMYVLPADRVAPQLLALARPHLPAQGV